MSLDELLRTYFRAKDENRPHLLVDVFSSEGQLTIDNRSAQISFPGETVGLENIADVLVRQFNVTYENIYSFYLDRPGATTTTFTCDWLVGMTEKPSRKVRVGCGRYDWTFRGNSFLLVTKLAITIERMLVLPPTHGTILMQSLRALSYPWTSAKQVTSALRIDELTPVTRYISRETGR